jgi:hypothetical protein
MPAGAFSVDVRHSVWWIEHESAGRIWLGLTSQATDDITEVTTANTRHFGQAPSSASDGASFFHLALSPSRVSAAYPHPPPALARLTTLPTSAQSSP